MIKLFADFNNLDKSGRVRLNTNGTESDLHELQLELIAGLNVTLSDGEGLFADGVVEYSTEERIWVATVGKIYG
jgi:hypothetical protein